MAANRYVDFHCPQTDHSGRTKKSISSSFLKPELILLSGAFYEVIELRTSPFIESDMLEKSHYLNSMEIKKNNNIHFLQLNLNNFLSGEGSARWQITQLH